MTYEAIIFDCDGVLVSSEKLTEELELEMLNKLGCNITIEDLRRECFGKPQNYAFDYFKKRWPDKITDTFEQEYLAALNERYRHELEITSGVQNTIASLDVLIAVASNSTTEYLSLALSKAQLIDYFIGRMFSVDMVTHGKPAPDLYLAAAQKLGVEPEKCLVMEDSPVGVKAGVAAGMTVIGFTGGGNTFEGHAQILQMAGAKKVINKFPQIIDVLNEFNDQKICA